MSGKVIFRRGTYEQLKSAVPVDADSLYFVDDRGEIYRSVGANKPLVKLTDVITDYDSFEELETSLPTGIKGKLYQVGSELYFYTNDGYKTITAKADLDEFDAIKVEFDNTGTTLISTNVQKAIEELDVKVETDKVDIDEIKSDLDAIDSDINDMNVEITQAKNDSIYAKDKVDILEGKVTTVESEFAQVKSDVELSKTNITTLGGKVTVLEMDVASNTSDIVDLKTSEGKVKLTSTDTADFLNTKVDGTTVVVKNNKIVIKSIEGLNIDATDINQLSGIKNNVQVQLDALAQNISDSTSGLSYIGSFSVLSDLEAVTSPINGNLAVVSDADGEGAKVLYIYSDTTTSWNAIGEFEFASEFKDLKGVPDTYEANKFLKSDGSQIVYSEVRYSELAGRPSVSIAKIENAANIAHTHTFDEEVLNKFAESNGKLTYDNKEIATDSNWSVFEF